MDVTTTATVLGGWRGQTPPTHTRADAEKDHPIEQYQLLNVLGRSEGQTIVKDAVRLIIGRRTKEHANAVLLSATLFGELSSQLLLSFQSRHDIAILTKDDRLEPGIAKIESGIRARAISPGTPNLIRCAAACLTSR